jgi:cytochrome c oxidase subunit 2
MNELFRRFLFLPEQASTVAPSVDHLHYFVIGTTLILSTVVGLTALGFFVRYRRRSEIELTPIIAPSLWFEVITIGLPLAFFLGWSWIGFRGFVRLQTPPPGAMDVYVMAKQWMWKFAYPDGPSSIGVLRVPAHRPVRLLLTSRDVIHSFYVPSFRIKQDALPGRYTQIWFEATQTGRFQVLCAEYCGTDHSNMWGEVVVVRPEEFDAWMAAAKRAGPTARQDMAPTSQESPEPNASMPAIGQRLAAQLGCLKCHSVDGSPHIGPTWLDLYGRREPMQDGQTIVVDEAYLTESMMDPRAHVVAGFAPVMPTFQGRLAGPDTAAIVEYIKSLRTSRVAATAPGGATYAPTNR